MPKAPILRENSKKQSEFTKNPTKTSIKIKREIHHEGYIKTPDQKKNETF